MLSDRFAHLRVRDSDSDSDDERKNTRRRESTLHASTIAQTDNANQAPQGAKYAMPENPQVAMPPVSDVMSKGAIPNPHAKHYVKRQEATAPPENEVSKRKASTPSRRNVASKTETTIPGESEVNRRKRSASVEKDIVRKSETITPSRTMKRESKPSERVPAEKGHTQFHNVAIPPKNPSGVPFPQGVHEKRSSLKRRSVNTDSVLEQSRGGEEEKSSARLSMTIPSEAAKSTVHVSSAKNTSLEERTQGQDINASLGSQKEENCKAVVSSSVEGLQVVVGGEGKEKESNLETRMAQELSTPLMGLEGKEVGMLSEKYWEKTYGFDPSKRGLPLFVVVEHSPPRNLRAVSNPPQGNFLQPDFEDLTSVLPSGNENVTNNMLTAECDPMILEEFNPATYNDIIQQGKTGFTGGPLVTDIPVVGADGDSTVDRVNSTDPMLNTRDVEKDAKRDIVKEGNANRSKSSVDGSACEEVPLGKDCDGAIGEDEMNFQENCKEGSNNSANDEERPDASKVEACIQVLPTVDEDVINFSSDVVGSQGENDRKGENSKVFASDVMINATATGHLSNSTPSGSFAKEINDGGVQDPQKGVENSHSAREGALQTGNGMIEGNGEPVNMTPLTVENVVKLTEDESGMVGTDMGMHDISFTESSLFVSCISLPTNDVRKLTRGKKVSRHHVNPILPRRNPEKKQEPSVPPFYRRLLLDMEEKEERERKLTERSLEECVLQLKVSGGRKGRLPQRHSSRPVSTSTSAAAKAEYSSLPPPPPTITAATSGRTTKTKEVPQERPRSVPRRLPVEEPLPTFKPEISKFAKETQQSNIPYHERLYAPKAVAVGANGVDPSNGHSLQLSLRLAELIDHSNSHIFCPDISPRARAIENEDPFYQRLYPSKEELERRRAKGQSPPVSPRRQSPQCGPIHISPRLLERPAPPPDIPSYSFRPEISPRAREIEHTHPFYQRLYPEKELQRRTESQSPPVSPRRQSPQCGPIHISPRLLERPAPPPDIPSYSFRPEISPRARSISRQGPFHERLYQLKEEKESQDFHRDQNSAFISSLHPNYAESARRAGENDNGVRRNVVRRLSKPKKVPLFL